MELFLVLLLLDDTPILLELTAPLLLRLRDVLECLDLDSLVTAEMLRLERFFLMDDF